MHADEASVRDNMAQTDIALARDNFKRWNDTLQTKDAAAVASMYDGANLSFLPTVSPKHIKVGTASS